MADKLGLGVLVGAHGGHGEAAGTLLLLVLLSGGGGLGTAWPKSRWVARPSVDPKLGRGSFGSEETTSQVRQ